MSHRGQSPHHPYGFTLIEVLVAFAILAIALGSLLQAFSTGLRGVAVAENRAIAALHARSKMDEVGHTIPVAAGQQTGSFENGFRWTVDLRETPSDGATSALALFEVTVTVAWGDDNQVQLRTLRLGGRS